MSSLLGSILKFTVGILFKKLRDEATKRLFGDPTDETLRELVSRELNEIKSKLDALLRKDLLSSVEFLEDGICHLQMSTSRDASSGEEHKTFTSDFDETFSLANIGLATIGMYRITSSKRYEKAQECFKIAGQEATRAFSNTALETDDRILATKLRIIARILEGIQDLELAVNASVMYLQNLHELPAVQEAFSVHLEGSVKSIFNKTERLQIIKNVSMINFILFGFMKRSTRLPLDLFTWPSIQLDEQIYQPVLRDSNIILTEFGVDAGGPFQFQFHNNTEICNIDSAAVDSKGKIIVETKEGSLSVICTITGKAEMLHNFSKQDTGLLTCRIDSVAIDNDDNVYVITCFRHQTFFNYKLWVFDSTGELKRDCILDFLTSRHIVGITAQIKIIKMFILIKRTEDEHVYICDTNGKLKFSFALKERIGQVFLSNSCENEIIVGQAQTVYVYTYEGNLRRQIKLPKDHKIYGLAFNEITKNIIVLSKDTYCMHIMSYDETNDMKTLLLSSEMCLCNLISHPKGLVALIDKKGGLFI